ncbi:methyltransferase domain protein [Ceratobasidium sp. AG-Ba]|nr:methyltransferase domain protein [Ceratobasidium sp. AG-Ba]
MATQFPHVQFRSLDVVPVIAHTQRPNFVLEVYDFTEGILLDDGSQDAVFLHFAMEMVRNYPALLCDVHRVFRPGGPLYIYDYSPFMWDPDDPSIRAAACTSPALCYQSQIFCEQASTVGIEVNALDKLPEWLAPGSILWDVDTGSSIGLERIHTIVRTHPLYPHDGYPYMSLMETRIAPYQQYLVVNMIQDAFMVLRDIGMEEKDAEAQLLGVED